MQARKMNRWTLAAAALVALGALSLAATPNAVGAAEDESHAESPKVIAAAFHADWCGMCKEMGPAFMEAKKQLLDEDILFVKFDLTDDATTHQSAMMASALGLEEVYEAQAPKTGAIKVVDASTGEVVTTLTVEHDAAAMKAQLEKTLAR